MSEANALTAEELYREASKNNSAKENRYDTEKLIKTHTDGVENIVYEAAKIAHRESDSKAKVNIIYGYRRSIKTDEVDFCNNFYYRAIIGGDVSLARFIDECEILLIDAVNSDDDKKIKLLFNSGQSLDKALELAVIRGDALSDNIQIFVKLIRMGANPNTIHVNKPIIFWPIGWGKLDVIKALVSRGARLDIRDTVDNRDALEHAEYWKSTYREWMEDAKKKGNNKEYRKYQTDIDRMIEVISYLQQELANQSKPASTRASDEQPSSTYLSQEQTRAISSREQRACETQKKSCYATCEGFSSKSPAIGLDSPKENCRDECRGIYCGSF
jgi:hypothetical protein